jgi:hypothetical protein
VWIAVPVYNFCAAVAVAVVVEYTYTKPDTRRGTGRSTRVLVLPSCNGRVCPRSTLSVYDHGFLAELPGLKSLRYRTCRFGVWEVTPSPNARYVRRTYVGIVRQMPRHHICWGRRRIGIVIDYVCTYPYKYSTVKQARIVVVYYCTDSMLEGCRCQLVEREHASLLAIPK